MDFKDVVSQIFEEELVFVHDVPQWEFDKEKGDYILDKDGKKKPELDKDGKQVIKQLIFELKHFDKKAWNQISVLKDINIVSLIHNDSIIERVIGKFDDIFVKITDYETVIEADDITLSAIDKLAYIKEFAIAATQKINELKKK